MPREILFSFSSSRYEFSARLTSRLLSDVGISAAQSVDSMMLRCRYMYNYPTQSHKSFSRLARNMKFRDDGAGKRKKAAIPLEFLARTKAATCFENEGSDCKHFSFMISRSRFEVRHRPSTVQALRRMNGSDVDQIR